MKFPVRILVMLLAVGWLAACTPGLFNITVGSGRVISEGREISNFQRVVLDGSGELAITQGNEVALVIEAEDNILPLIESEVRNGTLHLGIKPYSGLVNTRRGIKYNLTVQELSSMAVSGSGSISAGQLASDELTITVSGSGEVNIDSVTAGSIDVQISGSGDVDVAGIVSEQTIQISGSGRYGAEDLTSQQADISVSGSGDAILWVVEALDINVSGSGSVEYYGNPELNQRISGSGDTRHLGDK